MIEGRGGGLLSFHWNKVGTTLFFWSALFSALSASSGGDVSGQDLRLNEIQVVGTHNSYHVAAQPEVLGFIEGLKPEWRQSLDYTHLPLIGFVC